MLEKRIIGTDDSLPTLTRYVYSNHLQSASLELDGIGDIISYEEYHPYGTTAFQAKSATINAVAKRYRYTGKERDEESGLYYHGARYYIPWLAKWTAIDPINNENYNLAKGYGLEKNKERDFLHLTASPYECCKDNPIGNIDPDGEQAVPLNLLQAVPRTIPMRPPFSRNGFRNTGRGVGMNPNNVIIPPAGNLPARSVQVNDRTGAGYNSAAIEIIRNWFAPEPKRPTPAQSEAGFRKFVAEQRSKQQNIGSFVSMSARTEHEKRMGDKPAFERLGGPYTANDLAAISHRIRTNQATKNDLLVDGWFRSQNEMYEIHPKHDRAEFHTKVSGASLAPDNHAEIWDSRKENGSYDKKGNLWVAEGSGKKTIFHRFMNDKNGAFHWSGSTANGMDKRGLPVKGIDKQEVPIDLQRKFKAT